MDMTDGKNNIPGFSFDKKFALLTRLINNAYNYFKGKYPNERPYWKIRCYKYSGTRDLYHKDKNDLLPKHVDKIFVANFDKEKKQYNEVTQEKTINLSDKKEEETTKLTFEQTFRDTKTTNTKDKKNSIKEKIRVENKTELLETKEIITKNKFELLEQDIGDIEIEDKTDDLFSENVSISASKTIVFDRNFKNHINVNDISVDQLNKILKEFSFTDNQIIQDLREEKNKLQKKLEENIKENEKLKEEIKTLKSKKLPELIKDTINDQKEKREKMTKEDFELNTGLNYDDCITDDEYEVEEDNDDFD